MSLDTERVAAFCKENPNAQLIPVLLAFTQRAYEKSLAPISCHCGVGVAKFAPWDIYHIQPWLTTQILSVAVDRFHKSSFGGVCQ
jgi:hypothetical protein